uniref:Uncharacterized protein n=1 Tax=Cacopsylla melanoneura TaxID=428564 RepID=A0A8D8ZC07_9HEMI
MIFFFSFSFFYCLDLSSILLQVVCVLSAICFSPLNITFEISREDSCLSLALSRLSFSSLSFYLFPPLLRFCVNICSSRYLSVFLAIFAVLFLSFSFSCFPTYKRLFSASGPTTSRLAHA